MSDPLEFRRTVDFSWAFPKDEVVVRLDVVKGKKIARRG